VEVLTTDPLRSETQLAELLRFRRPKQRLHDVVDIAIVVTAPHWLEGLTCDDHESGVPRLMVGPERLRGLVRVASPQKLLAAFSREVRQLLPQRARIPNGSRAGRWT
jgi:hypothetical protein